MPTRVSCFSFFFFFVLWLSILATTVHGGGTNEEGLQYLKENSQKDGVVTLDSGLQYRVLQKGSGIYHPSVSSPCLCHYQGTLITGETFDSSYDRGSPTTFAPNQVIKGWTEAMQLMVEGDKWELTIPSELAYGDTGSPPKIPGGSVLVFVMEILEIQGHDKIAALRCNPHDTNNDDELLCNERELAYIAKFQTKHANNVVSAAIKETQRLESMKNNKMKPELQEWIARRLHILQQLAKKEEAEAAEL